MPVYDSREKNEKGTPVDGVNISNGSNGLNASSVKNGKSEKEDKDKEVVVDDLRWNDLQYVLINYKTELCRKPPRQCRQGYACPMYHNNKDRRRSPKKSKYRSTPCPNVKHGDEWGDPSHCESGDNCAYCHTRTEQQFHAEVYKSTKCNDVLQTGKCPRGPFCAFAHSDQELGMDRAAAIVAEEVGAQLPPLSAGPYSATVAAFGNSSQFDQGHILNGGRASPDGSTGDMSHRSSCVSETLASLESSYAAALQQQHRNSASGSVPYPRFSAGSAASPGVPIRQMSCSADMAAAVHALSSSWNAVSLLSSFNNEGSSLSSGLGTAITSDCSPTDPSHSLSQSLSLSHQSKSTNPWGLSDNNALQQARLAAAKSRKRLGRSMSLNVAPGSNLLSPRSADFSNGIPLLVPNEEPDDFDLTSIDKELLSASSGGHQSIAERLGLSSSRITHDSGGSSDSINGNNGGQGNSNQVWTPPNSANLGLSDNGVFLPNTSTVHGRKQNLNHGVSVPDTNNFLQQLANQQAQQQNNRQYQHRQSEHWTNETFQPDRDRSGTSRMRSLSSCIYPSGTSFLLSPRPSVNIPETNGKSDSDDLSPLLSRCSLGETVSYHLPLYFILFYFYIFTY